METTMRTWHTPDTDPAIGEEYIDEDGYRISADGEVLGLTTLYTRADPFVIDHPEKAEWLLGVIAKHEGNLVGLAARRRAILEQLDRMEKSERARLDWLHRRFDGELAGLVRRLLAEAGSKAKTWRFAFGSVAFRASKGTNKITDMDQAVDWMRRVGLGAAVRVVESVTVTAVLDAIRTHRIAPESDPYPNFIESTGPRETVSITTGIEGA